MKLLPDYEKLDNGEAYFKNLLAEYEQSVDEGLDIEKYKKDFEEISNMPDNEEKVKKADVLFEAVQNAPVKPDFKFDEPSQLDEIKNLRRFYSFKKNRVSVNEMTDRIYGAWLGRICGCLLGKPCEGRRADVLIPFLKATGNYPMHRYVLKTDFKDGFFEKYPGFEGCTCFADIISSAPVDDDTNYTVLAQKLIEKFGRNFTSENVIDLWVSSQPKTAYYTAERIALINRINGFLPPLTAVYKNPFREWIGAQIRGDYFGYINPGNPELAAEMAFSDASISHTKNGIYGEMFVAATLACASVCDSVEDAVLGGLAQIPSTSRLYKEISELIKNIKHGLTFDTFYNEIHQKYDEYSGYGWCHTIPNAMIVVASLLFGNDDYGKTICLAVQSGYDTDCNGATAGSIFGMLHGKNSIGRQWTAPLHNSLSTSIENLGTVDIDSLVRTTVEHIDKND